MQESDSETPSWVGENWNPSQKYAELVHYINELLQAEKRTLRSVYYALEARGHHYTYNQVKYAMKRGRQAGYIDPALVYDSELKRRSVHSHDGIDEYLEWLSKRDLAEEYHPDPWANQPKYVEVWVETKGLYPLFSKYARRYDVRLEMMGGDYSLTGAYEATQRFARKLEEDKECVVLYFGDFNPSGYHAPVAIQKNMQKYGVWQARPEYLNNGNVDWSYYMIDTTDVCEENNVTPPQVKFKRIALNLNHVVRFDNMKENPAPSKSDKDRKLLKRFKRFVSEGRDTNIQLESLKEYHREYLENLIEQSILAERDEELHQEYLEQTKAERERIRENVELDVNL